MNIDDRARRAARALHDAAAPDPADISRATDRVHSAGATRRRQLRAIRTAGGVLAVLAIVGIAVAVIDRNRSEDGERIAIDDPTVTTTTLETTTTSVPERDPRDDFALVPATPIDGLDSYRLPVIAIAQNGLNDGDTITVVGKGFLPDEQLAVVQCASEAITEGAGACDLSGGGGGGGQAEYPYPGLTYVSADAVGEVEVSFVVRRHITSSNDGAVDCASAAERCMVGIGALSDYDRSGSTFVNFAGAPAFPTPQIHLDPAEVTVGQEVAVTVDGWLPGRSIRIQQCVGDVCQDLTDGYSTHEGTFDASVVTTDSVTDANAPGSDPVPCGDGCTIRAVPIDIPEATSMPPADPVAVTWAG